MNVRDQYPNHKMSHSFKETKKKDLVRSKDSPIIYL